jgi:hypothetical protein
LDYFIKVVSPGVKDGNGWDAHLAVFGKKIDCAVVKH